MGQKRSLKCGGELLGGIELDEVAGIGHQMQLGARDDLCKSVGALGRDRASRTRRPAALSTDKKARNRGLSVLPT